MIDENPDILDESDVNDDEFLYSENQETRKSKKNPHAKNGDVNFSEKFFAVVGKNFQRSSKIKSSECGARSDFYKSSNLFTVNDV